MVSEIRNSSYLECGHDDWAKAYSMEKRIHEYASLEITHRLNE